MVTMTGALGMFVYGRIPQFAGYHAFADERSWLHVPHAADVLSNAGFAAAGLWGLGRLFHNRAALATKTCAADLLFLLSLVMTAGGSAFYHLAPDDARLVWDRLPIALGCAALLAGVRAEPRDRHTAGLVLGLLVACAVVSVWWWQWTNGRGSDDLRPYLLLQALPLVLIPLWQWEDGAAPARRRAFGVAIALYAAAKLFELHDRDVFVVALGVISGHTIKHLLASVAAAILAREISAPRAEVAMPVVMTAGGRREAVTDVGC